MRWPNQRLHLRGRVNVSFDPQFQRARGLMRTRALDVHNITDRIGRRARSERADAQI